VQSLASEKSGLEQSCQQLEEELKLETRRSAMLAHDQQVAQGFI
jgi:hypothetical protein